MRNDSLVFQYILWSWFGLSLYYFAALMNIFHTYFLTELLYSRHTDSNVDSQTIYGYLNIINI